MQTGRDGKWALLLAAAISLFPTFRSYAGSLDLVRIQAETGGLVDMTEEIESFSGGIAVRTYLDSVAPDGLSSVIDRVLNDARNRSQTPVGDMSMVVIQEVIWRDASLGCPEKSMKYMPKTIEGLRLVISRGDDLLDYRTEGIERILLCRYGRPSPVS